jgi:hypothetical protein
LRRQQWRRRRLAVNFAFFKGIYDCCSITWTIFSHLLQLDDEPTGPFIRVE